MSLSVFEFVELYVYFQFSKFIFRGKIACIFLPHKLQLLYGKVLIS